MMQKYGAWDKYGQMLRNAASKSLSVLERETAKQAAILASDIKKNIRSSGSFADKPFKPIKESTIKRKGSSKPLIDTGDMMNSATAAKIDNLSYLVGIPGDVSGGKTNKTIAEYARMHEFGGLSETGVLIDARPFLGPVVEKTRKQRISELEKSLKEKLFKL